MTGTFFRERSDRATAVAVGPRDDDRLVMNPGSAQDASFSLSRLYPSERRAWTDYLTGVASLLQVRGKPPVRSEHVCLRERPARCRTQLIGRTRARDRLRIDRAERTHHPSC